MDPKVKRVGSEVLIAEQDGAYETWVSERHAYVDGLIDKWMPLIEGTRKQALKPIEPRHYAAMAILFENQVLATQRALGEATKTSDVVLPVKYTLPIVRLVFPELMAMRIASVQPMPMSSGGVMKVFYQDFLKEDLSDESVSVPDCDYSDGAENSVPKRIKMSITSDQATAVKKILGASWSQEVEEDAAGALNINVEAELVTQMSGQILRELDQIMLTEMLVFATAGNVPWSWTVPANTLAKDYYETLAHAMIDAEDLVYGYRYRPCDYVIGGRNFIKYVRKMQDFNATPRNQPGEAFSMGVEKVGEVTGFWDVWMSPYLPTNRAFMGYYPRTETDTCYIFAPYVPLTPMPKVYAEYLPHDDATLPGAYVNTDKWSRNVRTRYAKKFVVPRGIATLSIGA